MGGRLPCSCGFEEKDHPINKKGNQCKTFTPGGKPKTLAKIARMLSRPSTNPWFEASKVFHPSYRKQQ